MFNQATQDFGRSMARRLVARFANSGLTPNMLTMAGFVLTLCVAAVLATGQFVLGGVLMMIITPFDMLDGALAKVTNRVSKFGAFLDSTMDRYCDAALLGGVMLYYLLNPQPNTVLVTVLVFLALLGSSMVSYTRARAESLNIECKVGMLARPERILILAAGLILSGLWMEALIVALIILAVGTHITAVQRIWHVYKTLN